MNIIKFRYWNMLFLLQPVFRCPEKGLLGDVYSPPDNDRSHDVQVSQVKMMFKILKSERKLRKHWYFSWTTHSHRIGTLVLIVHDCADHLLELAKMFRYTLLQIHALSQIQIHNNKYTNMQLSLTCLPASTCTLELPSTCRLWGRSWWYWGFCWWW